MATYSDIKGGLLERAGGARPLTIQGVPLDGGDFKGWRPIRPCICVTEPCPCDKLDDLIVWLPATKRGESTNKQADSADVVSYPIEADDEMLVEVQIPMTVAQLRQIKEWSERQDGSSGDSGSRSGDSGGTAVAKKKKKPMSPAQAVLGAFLVGYALGEKIDEGTGLSDKISDFAAEHVPWPF